LLGMVLFAGNSSLANESFWHSIIGAGKPFRKIRLWLGLWFTLWFGERYWRRLGRRGRDWWGRD